MKRGIITLILYSIPGLLLAQNSFKAGWNTYTTGTLTHEYNYNCSLQDSIRLTFTDSAQIYTTADSGVIMRMVTPPHERSIIKSVNYLNAKKQLIKSEEYKDENLQWVKEWRYDDKNFLESYLEDNKANGNVYRKTYERSFDRKSGENIITECAYFNGRIEFYTKSYFDKKNSKYKEVRLNNNNKDVVHIESFTYGENGKVKERSVYFPEWRVTKKFTEKEGSILPKCNRIFPVGIADKVTLAARVSYMQKVIRKNMAVLSDSECPDFEYRFRNWTTTEIKIGNGYNASVKKVSFLFREKF